MKSIRTQLIAAFLIVNFFVLLVGGIGYYSVDSVASSITVFENYSSEASLISETYSSINQMEKAARNLMTTDNQDEINDFSALASKIRELQSSIVRSNKTKVEQVLLYLLNNYINEYISIFENEMVMEWKDHQEAIQSQTADALLNNSSNSIESSEVNYVYQSKMNSIYSKAHSKKLTIDKVLTLLQGYFSNRQDNMSTAIRNRADVVRQLILGVSILSVAIALTLSVLYSRSFIAPIKTIVKLSEQVENGILTEEFNIKRKDELGTLGRSFSGMLKRISSLITEVKLATETVDNSLLHLNEATNTVLVSSEQISSAIEQVTLGNTEAADGMSQISNSMKNIVDDINDVKLHINTILSLSGASNSVVQSGQIMVTNAVEQISTVKNIFDETNKNVASLQQGSAQISNIIELVREIGERTNLLSLNASIEAARAGEHGRGFAVVAEEIRKLAMQSDSSLNDIKAIVDNIQSEIDCISRSSEKGNLEIAEGSKGMEAVSENFTEISEALLKLNGSIDAIASKISIVTDSSRGIFDSVSNVVAVAEQSTAAAQEITANTKEQTRMSEDSVEICKDMDNKFKNLKKLVAFFKTELGGNTNV